MLLTAGANVGPHTGAVAPDAMGAHVASAVYRGQVSTVWEHDREGNRRTIKGVDPAFFAKLLLAIPNVRDEVVR